MGAQKIVEERPKETARALPRDLGTPLPTKPRNSQWSVPYTVIGLEYKNSHMGHGTT